MDTLWNRSHYFDSFFIAGFSAFCKRHFKFGIIPLDVMKIHRLYSESVLKHVWFVHFQMIGVSVIGLCFWLRFQGGIQEWLDILHATDFYIGIYILIIASLVVIIVSFLGCLSALQENGAALLGVSCVSLNCVVFRYILCNMKNFISHKKDSQPTPAKMFVLFVLSGGYEVCVSLCFHFLNSTFVKIRMV